MTPKAALLLILALGGAARADVPASISVRGTRVQWARLQTSSRYWDRHGSYDRVLLDYMQANTSFDIDPVPRVVSASSLDELCRVPFLFIANADHLSATDEHNLAEYVRRGGFILMDKCLEPKLNDSVEQWIEAQKNILLPEFPHLRIWRLPPNHPIFTAYFDLSKRPHTRQDQNIFQTPDAYRRLFGDEVPDRIGDLAGIYDGDRMIGVLSVSGFECDLAGFHRFASPQGAAQAVVNIYVYALTGNRFLNPVPLSSQ